VAASQAFVSRCTAVLAEVLGHIGVSCIIEPRPGEEPGVTILDVTGDSSGLLIGRRGQTLDALDYLINRVVARPGADSSGRVVIDVEHYRERRREYLETLARRLGEKAKQTRRVVTLNPMSPRDRRVVHLALQDDQALATRSQGDGYYRKVLILPAAGRRPSRSGREVG
jgi:spoIIIJ-associated protein